MKYKIIASITILLIVLAALLLRGGSNQSVDENGYPIQSDEQRY